MNWRTDEEVPRAGAKWRRRPRSGSARALPFVWDFAYGDSAGDSDQVCSVMVPSILTILHVLLTILVTIRSLLLLSIPFLIFNSFMLLDLFFICFPKSGEERLRKL